MSLGLIYRLFQELLQDLHYLLVLYMSFETQIDISSRTEACYSGSQFIEIKKNMAFRSVPFVLNGLKDHGSFAVIGVQCFGLCKLYFTLCFSGSDKSVSSPDGCSCA